MSGIAERVFIVDDDEAVRRGLERLLCSAGFAVEALLDAEALLAQVPSEAPCCLVLDLELGGMSGIELQEQLLELGSDLPIVFLTGRGDTPTSVRAMRHGAVDFLEKPVDEDDLLDAVRAGLARHAELCAERRKRDEWRSRAGTLTPREHEILGWVIAGTPNKGTAQALGIAEKTVKVHRGRVMAKMGARSVAELVRMCQAINVEPAGPAA